MAAQIVSKDNECLKGSKMTAIRKYIGGSHSKALYTPNLKDHSLLLIPWLLDEQFIVNFLRGCKFSLQRTKEKIKQTYIMRSLAPEFFSDRDPFLPEIQEVLEHLPIVIIRERASPTAPHVILRRTDYMEPSQFSVSTISKILIMMVDILMWEDDSFVICGQHGVVNTNALTVDHVVQITPTFVNKAVTRMERAYPLRVKGLHSLNTPRVFVKVFNFMKQFLSKKLQARYHLYEANNMEDFYKQIPKSMLPPECGGNGEPYDELKIYWKNKLESYRDWFLEDSKYKADGKQLGYDSLDIEGSFRKLDID